MFKNMLNFDFEYDWMPVLSPVIIPTKGKGFWGALKIWLTQSRKWELREPFKFRICGINYTIEKGFVFDGASVPRCFWMVLNPVGILLIPGLVHDYIYRYGFLRCDDDIIKYTRKQADEIFEKIAIHINGFKAINNVAYAALRGFGAANWKAK